jgi:GNAT superfamily N-acetyltransferase
MNAETLYLEDLYIHPDLRDKGQGTMLFESIIAIAKSNGCSKLLTSITLTNKYRDKNMQIFLHKGFSITSVGQNIIYLVKEI